MMNINRIYGSDTTERRFVEFRKFFNIDITDVPCQVKHPFPSVAS